LVLAYLPVKPVTGICRPEFSSDRSVPEEAVLYYYQHHIGDYRRDTGHLTLLEHGIYRQLLDLYYITEKPFDASAMRLICVRTTDEEEAYKRVLNDFFVLKNGKYHHKRCQIEIEGFQSKSNKAKDSAKIRWNKNKDLQDAIALPTHSDSDANGMLTMNHKPLTINQQINPIAESDKSLPAVEFIPLVDGSEWPVPESFAVDLEKSYPAVDMKQTLREIRAWNLANPKNRKTISGIKRHINQWFSKEQNRG
jgi:uncharacterized protein YdaU (DUF1376 family)